MQEQDQTREPGLKHADSEEVNGDTLGPNDELDKATAKVKTAAILASISGTLTTIFAVLGFFITEVEGTLGAYLDPWLLIDAAIIWFLAYLLFQRSFIGSLAMIAYWIFTIILALITLPGIAGLFVKLYFLYGFINGARGAYILRKANPPATMPLWRKIAVWSSVSITTAVVLFLFTFGMLIETGVVPSYEVEDHSSMPDRQVAQLRENSILAPGETIALYYSAGVTNIMEDGNIITNQRVISYWTDENEELQVIAASFSDLSEVEVLSKGDAMNDTVLRVTQTNGDSFQLFVTVEGNGDNRFYQNINRRINR